MVEKRIDAHTVQMAIQAIEHFYKKYEAKFDRSTIVAFAIALSAGEKLELTPSEKAFRRIMVTEPQGRNRHNRVVLVFSYDDLDRAKTDELNELINRFTHNALIRT